MKKPRGLEAFQAYYAEQWGERWESLSQSLLKPEIQVLRWNAWMNAEEKSAREQNFLTGCQLRPVDFAGPQRLLSGLLDSYVMDPASIIAARCLPVKDGDLVLDLCAAPGGKTLILAEKLATAGELFANESSAERRNRLQKVIQQYVPREVRERIWVKGQDGSLWGVKQSNQYQAVLADVPCSGERHLLSHPSELEDWTPQRGTGLAHRQYALLCSAWMSTAPGGYFLYSTCSINPQENEGVVQKFLKKKEGFALIQPKIELEAEARDQGMIFLPDRCGFGPLYFCLFRKDFP